MTQRYSDHIHALAAEHGIALDIRKATRGMSWGAQRRIRITTPNGPVSYAVALHEIGHCVDAEGHGRRFSRLHKEYRAWRWARLHAIKWTDRMDGEMQRSMRCYLDSAKRRRWPIPTYVYTIVEG